MNPGEMTPVKQLTHNRDTTSRKMGHYSAHIIIFLAKPLLDKNLGYYQKLSRPPKIDIKARFVEKPLTSHRISKKEPTEPPNKKNQSPRGKPKQTNERGRRAKTQKTRKKKRNEMGTKEENNKQIEGRDLQKS